MKRFLALVLCVLMACTLCCSAFAADYPEYLNLDSYYPNMVKEGYGDDIELNIAIIVSSDFSEDPQTRWFWTAMKEVFNLNCKVTQVTNQEEYITLTFAANDLPDMIIGAGLTSTQLYNYAIGEEQLLNIGNYITPELTPTLWTLFEEYPEIKAGITLPDGGIYSFPYVMAHENTELFANSAINVDMLKELGYEDKPHTLDELVEVLYKMKDLGEDVLPLAGNWENSNPMGIILRALGYDVINENKDTAQKIALKNGEVVLTGADADYKKALELMNKFYTDGIITPDFFTDDLLTLQAQTGDKRIGALGSYCYTVNPDPTFYQQFETIPVLTSDVNSEAFAIGNSFYTTGGVVISADTKYPELLLRLADWLMTAEGTSAYWVGANKNNEALMLEGWGGWYLNESYSRCDVDRETYPDKWTGAVEYLRGCVSGFNMGSIGNCMKEGEFRQSASGLTLRADYDTWSLDPNNAGFYYRTNAYDEQVPYLRTALSTTTFFFDEATADRLVELESVLCDYIKNQTALFITGTRSLDEFDAYIEELNKLGAQEYVGYYAEAYAARTK